MLRLNGVVHDALAFKCAGSQSFPLLHGNRKRGAGAAEWETSRRSQANRHVAIRSIAGRASRWAKSHTGPPFPHTIAPFRGNAASDKPEAASSYTGKADEAAWLPNEAVAKAWAEYVSTGATSDTTAPPAPVNVKVTITPDKSAEIAPPTSRAASRDSSSSATAGRYFRRCLTTTRRSISLTSTRREPAASTDTAGSRIYPLTTDSCPTVPRSSSPHSRDHAHSSTGRRASDTPAGRRRCRNPRRASR